MNDAQSGDRAPTYKILAERIAEALSCGRHGCDCAKRSGKGFKTHCPTHGTNGDDGPSLSLTPGDKTPVVVHCFGGCRSATVIAELRRRQLWPDHSPSGTRSRPKLREVRYSARRADGGPLHAEHVRMERLADGKKEKMWWERDGRKGLKGLPVAELALYRIEDLNELPDGSVVVLCEGESATDALRARGVVAVGTVTGAATIPVDDALAVLVRFNVRLWADNDDAGRRHMQGVAARLVALGCREVRLVRWPDAPAKGDAADFARGDDDLRRLLDDAQPIQIDPEIDLAALLDDVRRFARRYVVLSDLQADVIALWVAHTHALDAFDGTPYLEINSAEKRSGKTRLLEALSLVVARAWLTGRVSTAVLVRKCDRETPTLLLDESDAAFKGDKDYSEALRGILNSGYRRGGVASLCVKGGGDFEVRDFSTFGAKAIAGIGKLPDTVSDRGIKITLKRRSPAEKIERFYWRVATPEGATLRDRLDAWALTAMASLTVSRPDLPGELDDRAADGWEPLLAISDEACGAWPSRARAAARSLSVGDTREDDSLNVRLLRDIRLIFGNRTRIAIAQLVEELIAIDDAPWGDLKGKPLDTRGLGWRLKPYGVKARTIRLDDQTTARGYMLEWFADAWARYVPEKTDTSDTTDTLDRNDVTVVTDVTVSPGIDSNGAVPVDDPLCTSCGADAEYRDGATWYCDQHGPIWTKPKTQR